MSLASPVNTLAHFQARALTIKRDLREVGLPSVVKQLNLMLTEDPDLVRPEAEALRFYGMNHGVALIRSRRDLLEPLTLAEGAFLTDYHARLGFTARKVFSYLLVTCTREARHCHTAIGNIPVKMEDLAPGATTDDLHDVTTAVNWLLASHGGEDGIYGALRKSPPPVSIGDFARALSVVFRRGAWGSAYGGPKWAAISDCVVHFVEGVISAEMMLDTAWTLEHNTASVFNKGLIFFSVSGLLSEILDVQRSGQIPTMALGLKGTAYVDENLFDAMTWLRQEFPDEVGRYVDWFKVSALGAVGIYTDKQNQQLVQHGPSPWMGEEAKKAVLVAEAQKAAAKKHAEEWFQVMPGVEVPFKKMKRAA